MADVTAQRTLVKSPPELWSELSEIETLARHLGELGEIRITKVEPETTVAWEGEQISGTVELEQSGWGTKVTLRATVPEPDRPAVAAAVEPGPEPVAVEPEPAAPEPPAATEEPEREPRRGFWARLLGRHRATETQSADAAPPEPSESESGASEPRRAEPEPESSLDADSVHAVLDGTLDALGQAHHRPFSRS